MSTKSRYKSTACRIREICELTQEHYEPGNQSKCYRAVWRKYIEPKYGICYRTYLNYIGEPTPPNEEDKNQLRLFKDE